MIFHVATLMLILLKVFEKIDWSWWLVLSPSIFALTLVFTLVAGAIYLKIKD